MEAIRLPPPMPDGGVTDVISFTRGYPAESVVINTRSHGTENNNLNVPHSRRGEPQQDPPSLGSSIVSSPPTPTFDPYDNPDASSTSVRSANAYPPTWRI